MTREEFIKAIAKSVQKYAPQFGIKVCSPIIAQAILESAYGTSYKAKYHNYHGLKYRKNRVTCNNGYFEDGGSEQNKDGSYTKLPSNTAWYSFDSLDKSVLGYFQFINTPNYSNLKGVTDPYQYLVNIKKDGYATSLNYVDNVYKVIKDWNLTKYDNIKEETKVKIKIVKKIATKNRCYKANKKITPKGEMLHSVGCPQPDPLVFVKIWNNENASNCVHAVVGKDPTVYLILPYNHRAWHCGSGSKGSGNNYLISLEMTEPSTIKYTSGSGWVETGNGANTKAHVLATYKNAVEFFAYLGNKYGFDVTNSNVVMSHKEGNSKGIASNHGDPEHIWKKFGLTMNQFRKDVKKAMSGESVTTVPSTSVDTSSDDTSKQKINTLKGTVIIIYKGADGLNLRKAPCSLSKYVDHVEHSGTFKVVGISADEKWYKLDNGLFITTIPDYVKFKATEEQKVSTAGTGYYRVRKSWGDSKSQIGAFKDKNNAIDLCKQNSGYKVFDNSGKEIYPLVKEDSKPFKFKVTIPDLKIRKGAGTTYDYHKKNGKAVYTGKGIFTIVKTKEGAGAKLWGLLKSYEDSQNGWIALDEEYGKRV